MSDKKKRVYVVHPAGRRLSGFGYRPSGGCFDLPIEVADSLEDNPDYSFDNPVAIKPTKQPHKKEENK